MASPLEASAPHLSHLDDLPALIFDSDDDDADAAATVASCADVTVMAVSGAASVAADVDTNFTSHKEFQVRGMVHTHCVICAKKSQVGERTRASFDCFSDTETTATPC